MLPERRLPQAPSNNLRQELQSLKVTNAHLLVKIEALERQQALEGNPGNPNSILRSEHPGSTSTMRMKDVQSPKDPPPSPEWELSTGKDSEQGIEESSQMQSSGAWTSLSVGYTAYRRTIPAAFPFGPRESQVVRAAKNYGPQDDAGGGEERKPPAGQRELEPAMEMGGDLVEIKKGSSNQSKIAAMVHRALEKALKLSGTCKDGGKGLLRDLEEQFLSIIANSNGDDVHFLELYVGVWYAEKWPHEELDKQEVENMKGFLVMVARRAARLKNVKKRKMGATVKIVSTLFIGYFDIMTDFLVAKSYYEQDKMNMAYGTAGCALLAIMMQAVTTFFQYGRKPLRERVWRTLVAMTGLAPLMEGKRLWMGVEDTDLVVTAPVMFAGMKALEVSFEAVPEAIIQVSGLLSANLDEIKWIQIVGVISSVVCGAFIMTDGNFGFIQSKHMKSPWDPFYNWVPRHPGFGKMSCKFGMFLFILCYFSQFIWSMSLFGEYGEVWRQGRTCFFFIGIEYLVVCAYMGRKGEAFGVSVVSHPLSRRDHVLPFILWGLYYLLVCAAPMLIAAAPCELGPEVFSSVIVWRLFTNGILTFIALQRLPASHYLTVQTGMLVYWFCLIGALLGLAIFLRNCDKNFTIGTFWKPISAKKHVKRIWRDPRVWEKAYMTKDEEIWGWVWKIHPTYLPFDALTTWLCEDLVDKYGGRGGEEGGLERPDFLSGKFVTRMYTIYLWRKDLDEEEARRVDSALNILFGREGGRGGSSGGEERGRTWRW